MTRAVESADMVTAAEPAGKRHYRSKQERRRIVEESLQPGASVAMVARSHGVNANQVFNWRKLYGKGLLNPKPATTQLMPVRIAEVVDEEQKPSQHYSGTIQIELGRARVRVEGSVDPDSLRLILELIDSLGSHQFLSSAATRGSNVGALYRQRKLAPNLIHYIQS